MGGRRLIDMTKGEIMWKRIQETVQFLDGHAEYALTMLRFYLGVGLVVRGALWVFNPEPLAESREHALGLVEQVLGVDHGRHGARPFPDGVEELHLLG